MCAETQIDVALDEIAKLGYHCLVENQMCARALQVGETELFRNREKARVDLPVTIQSYDGSMVDVDYESTRRARGATCMRFLAKPLSTHNDYAEPCVFTSSNINEPEQDQPRVLVALIGEVLSFDLDPLMHFSVTRAYKGRCKVRTMQCFPAGSAREVMKDLIRLI